MIRTTLVALAFLTPLTAEVHPLTLRQAVERALQQSPDIVLARLNQQKAVTGIRIARDPFMPKVVMGSGLAYNTGYPLNINGDPPSVFETKAVMSIFNLQQRYVLAQAKEDARTAVIDETAKRDDVTYRTASLFLDVLRLAQARDMAARQVESFQKVSDTVAAMVDSGRALKVDADRAALNLARARQRVEALGLDTDYGEGSLAVALGYGGDDRVRAVDSEDKPGSLPATEAEIVEQALANSREIKKLESQLQAKQLLLSSYKLSRLPTVDLIAQYNIFARYYYQNVFNPRRYQANNGQIGFELQIPALNGSANSGQAVRAALDITGLRNQINNTREQIKLDTRHAYQDVKRGETARDVAKMDLDVTRADLSVSLSRMEEGRANLAQIEQLRMAENEKWIAFYDAQHALEKAQLTLLKEAGTIVAALR
jgi:outer membrane protein